MTEELGIFQVTDPKHLEAIENLLGSKGTFVEMAEILGLDKAVDFQGTNLRGVDFTGSDLRGFDFTGADLRGSHGVNLAYDHTTRLENADVQESPFGYIALERAVRHKNAGFDREYDKLKNSYWSDQLPYITDRIKASSDRKDVQLMAMRLFVDAKDNVVRGDMIRALDFADMDRDYFLSFLLHVCATRKEPVVITAAIDALGGFRNLRPAFDTLLALTSHESELVKVAAYETLVRSRYLEEARDVIVQKLADYSSPLVRQAIARGIAPMVGRYGRAIMAYQPFSKTIGFKQILTERDMYGVANHVGGSFRGETFDQVFEQAYILAYILLDMRVILRLENESRRDSLLRHHSRRKP